MFKMRSQYNKPEILSFSFQEIYLSRRLIKSRKHLINYIRQLAERRSIKMNCPLCDFKRNIKNHFHSYSDGEKIIIIIKKGQHNNRKVYKEQEHNNIIKMRGLK